MIDPEARAEMVFQSVEDENVGVILFDLMLGRGSAPDPAGPLARAIKKAGRKANDLVFVASVVGTEGDPQGLDAQIRILEEAGVVILPSNAQAARFAAALIKPELLEDG